MELREREEGRVTLKESGLSPRREQCKIHASPALGLSGLMRSILFLLELSTCHCKEQEVKAGEHKISTMMFGI